MKKFNLLNRLKGFVLMAHRNEVGAVVTSDFLAGLLTNFRAIFNVELSAADALGLYSKIATVFPSTGDKETYAWMGATPSMSEWKDQRILRALAAHDYTLTNKHYEATLEVDRDTLEDDKYGLITPRIQGLARAAIRYFDEKVFTLLDDGESEKGYDTDYYFFANTRVIGSSANIDNIIDGNYSDSADEIRAGIAAVLVRMRAFQDERGKPLNLVPDTIVCSGLMEMPIKAALQPAVAGTARPENEVVKNIVVSPWIDADTDDWFFLCTTGEVKPIILQLRKKPEMASLDDPKSEYVFLNNKFLYGVDSRFEVGFGDPRTAVLVHNT